MKKLLVVLLVLFACAAGARGAFALNLNRDELKSKLTSEKISLKTPETLKLWPEKVATASSVDDCNYAGFNEGNTGTTKARIINCVKTIYYQVEVWGNVVADVNDFKAKVAETYKDSRGWSQIATFKEVQEGADFRLILSDAASLDATPGCSGDLSCTTWSNQVIINDERWREGTEASRSAGMSTRDYQHMVINHETGHWLGHYAHEESCESGGPAPIMLQQSTGLRGCSSFNAWPLSWELWTLR
ncbi:DUF3152 domain-containing protein [Candidatus Saccharibacteria bacterium]|nr:DUF3152 domain-containing protein [Candidatus Saccharibacteria bacterium]MBQ9016916.1 DUF3152 domain-containing protein [Candidatus Saccharibacteria bacterium]